MLKLVIAATILMATPLISGANPDPVNHVFPEFTTAAAVPHQEYLWAANSLIALGAPDTALNRRTLYDWFCNEGAPHDYNNPLNLMTHYGGSYDEDATGDPYLQHYPTPTDFFRAFNLEMRDHGPDSPGSQYRYIIAAFMSGKGFMNSTNRNIENDLLIYSGYGYDRVPEWGC